MEKTLKNRLRESGFNFVKLADAIGANKSTTSRWAKNGVPAERCADVERITGIPRHELRPDIFGEGA